jgi:two-component system sensor histidine kinase HydH
VRKKFALWLQKRYICAIEFSGNYLIIINRMRILQQKKLYLPAYLIVAGVFILLVLISISTYRNLDREKKRAMAFVHRQGLTLLRAIEAGARTGLMMHVQQEDTVVGLIREVAKNEDIAYIYLFDRTGAIVHHSNSVNKQKITTWDFRGFEKDWVYSRLNRFSGGVQVYELAKVFSPRQPLQSMHHQIKPHLHIGDIIVIGLKMASYEAARRSDLHHAIVMAAIVFVLGSGVFFFIFVIQNYYLVERTLHRTRDYTRQIVASMANGLVSVDRDGNIVSYNQVAQELLGIEHAEIKDLHLSSVLDVQETGLSDVMEDCRTISDREILIHKNGRETIPLGISVSPIRDEGDICSGAVMILRDLRKIKQLEEKVVRSEKLAAVGQLAAGLAHEIRNPLSSIRGFAQFLRHALKSSPTEQEYADIMIKEIDRINRVVTDLLSFASPKTAEREATNADELAEHIIRLVEAEALTKQVRVSSHVAPNLKEVSIDAYQMTQALLNLVLNSLKFVDKEGNIDIRFFGDEALSQMVIEVEDDGPGIPPENLAKIFDPFFTTRETGTGLGLAIVLKIAENHQGDIDVESPPPGKSNGCRFTMRLPMGKE